MYKAAFNGIDETLRTDAGCSGELDYVEQTSWVLFLKYLDDYESSEEEMGEGLSGKPYQRIIKGKYRWSEWASPKIADNKLDHSKVMVGKDLLEFVNDELFPYLAEFKNQADSPSSLEYKIGEIFNEVKNKIQSGYILRDVIGKVDKLKFLSNEDKNELSELYETKISKMGNAGRNGGEYYTPRPIIQSMVKIIKPKIGETVYDGAVGSAGFLCEAFSYMRKSEPTSTQYKKLQEKTLYGKEKKSLPYVIGIMNMILHGIEAPNIIHVNTLEEDIADIQEKDRHNIVLANPPFAGDERPEVKENFPIKSGETAYLFLQHFIKILKTGGRAAVVIKSTFLSNTDNASVTLRNQLLTECNLFAILDLPQKVFAGAGVKTVVLFFNKGEPTKKIWYYQLNLGRNLGKRNPLNEKDLAEFLDFFDTKKPSGNSWSVDVKDIDKETWDLKAKNPNKAKETDERTSQEILKEIESMDKQESKILKVIFENSTGSNKSSFSTWEQTNIGGALSMIRNGINCEQNKNREGKKITRIETIASAEIDYNRTGFSVLNESQSSKARLEVGDILFSHINSLIHVGKTAIYDGKEPLWHGINLLRLRTIEEVDSKYFNYFLKFLFSEGYWVRVAKQSVNQASVNQKDIKCIPFSYPPLPEQKEIVIKLDKAFAEVKELVDICKKQIEEYNNLKSAFLRQELENEEA